MADENNAMLMVLIIYSVFVTFIFFPSYVLYNAEETLTDEINSNITSYNNLSVASDQIVNEQTNTISFMRALFITITEPVGFIVTLLFIVIPNVWLGVIIYDKVRGI